MSTDIRLNQLKQWLSTTLSNDFTIEVASADASFRRYFRVSHQGKTYIAMDAPPDKEDSSPFLDIGQRLALTGVHVPIIHAHTLDHGFLLLEDLGCIPYQQQLSEKADELYHDAMQALIKMQTADCSQLPNYNKQRLREEMQLMPDWFLTTHLNLAISDTQQAIIDNTFQQLLDAIDEQPQGFVHRDYHSRNLMVVDHNNPGIIDFQDAVYGAITYDLVSLLRDCYVCWPQSQVEQWALSYRDMAVQQGIIPPINDQAFIRWFDLIGLQRHIKVLGIFARLWHRDGKQHYLQDLPLTLSYVLHIGQKHPETQALVELFHTLGIPETIGTVNIPA